MPPRRLRARSKLMTSRRRCEGGFGADDARLVLSEEDSREDEEARKSPVRVAQKSTW